MVEKSGLKNPPTHFGSKKQFSFSLRLLMIVVSLSAAGTAFAANYPLIAAVIAFALVWELALPWVLQAAAVKFGQEKYRRMTIGITAVFVLGCAIWAFLRGMGPAVLGVWFGSFFILMVWLTGAVKKD